MVDKIEGASVEAANSDVDVAFGAVDYRRNVEVPALEILEKAQTALAFEFETTKE